MPDSWKVSLRKTKSLLFSYFPFKKIPSVLFQGLKIRHPLFFLHFECIKENILEFIFHKPDFIKKELHPGRFHVSPVISEMNLQEIALLVSGTA